MRPRVRHRAAACIPAVLLLAFAPLASALAPFETIGYVEFPEDGPLLDSGRVLSTSGGDFYGIDINSRLEIKVDGDALLSSLAGLTAGGQSARISALSERLKLLTEVATSLDQAQQDVRQLVRLFDSGSDEFAQALRRSANQRLMILTTLSDARKQRLVQEGIDADAAQRVARQAINPVLTGGSRLQNGYDWQALGELYAAEIALAAGELADLGEALGIKIEIQAHLVRADGQPVAAYLPNYNQAAIGADRRFEKLKFAPSAGENELYEQYREMARELDAQQSAGDAFLALLEQQYELLRRPLAEFTAEARKALEAARRELENLKAWQAQSKRARWFESVQSDLRSSAAGQRVIQSWEALGASLDEIRDDIEALEAYADLDGLLAGQDPAQAMTTIRRLFETIRAGDPRAAAIRVLDSQRWQRRLARLQDFVDAVDGLPSGLAQAIKRPGGPYADFVATRAALQDFAGAVQHSAGRIKTWISELVLGADVFRTAANLPVPEGLRQVPLMSGAQLNTAVNLRTIPAVRSIDDTLRIQFRFFREGEELPAGWVDQFALKSFGWRSEVLASLAFARHQREDTWKPTAAMNWILSHDAWPEGSQRGLRSSQRLRWFSGFGVSALALDAEASQDVELGVALTAAFLNNRLLLGYGVNLQAEEDEAFWFMSIRLFTFPGLSDQPGSSLTAQ